MSTQTTDPKVQPASWTPPGDEDIDVAFAPLEEQMKSLSLALTAMRAAVDKGYPDAEKFWHEAMDLVDPLHGLIDKTANLLPPTDPDWDEDESVIESDRKKAHDAAYRLAMLAHCLHDAEKQHRMENGGGEEGVRFVRIIMEKTWELEDRIDIPYQKTAREDPLTADDREFAREIESMLYALQRSCIADERHAHVQFCKTVSEVLSEITGYLDRVVKA